MAARGCALPAAPLRFSALYARPGGPQTEAFMDLSKHLEKADEARKRRNYGLAIGLYQQLLDLDPDLEEAREGLRLALDAKFQGGRGGGVLQWIQGFLPMLSAKIAGLTKNRAAEVRNLERFLAMGPGHVRANLALGQALEAGGWRRSAYVVYRHLGATLSEEGRSSSRAEEAGLAWRRAGAMAQALDRLKEAGECYEAALELDPRDQEALKARKNLAAEGALQEGGFASATHSRELIKDKQAQKEIERSQRLHKSREELLEELRETEGKLARAPEDPALLARVGDLRARTGDTQGALDCYERALGLEPGNRKLEDRVGLLRIRELEERIRKAELLEDEESARALRKELRGLKLGDLRRRVEMHPTDLGLRFEFGRALFEEGELDEGIAELQKAVQDPRRKLEALLLLGRAFKNKGLGDLARSQWEKALESVAEGPRKLEILYELGLLAEESGDLRAAREAFAKIIEVDIGFKDVAARLEALGSP